MKLIQDYQWLTPELKLSWQRPIVCHCVSNLTRGDNHEPTATGRYRACGAERVRAG